MRTITKTHQASGKSMILNPSVRIEPVRTDSRGRGIDVDGSNVYREQRAGRYTFRSSVVVEKQILFGALIKQADDGLSLASPERLHSATVCPAENAHKRLRAFFRAVTSGGGLCHFRVWQILLKKSKIERLRKSREGRLLGLSAAARLFKTNTRVRHCVCVNRSGPSRRSAGLLARRPRT
jgi:hypothetical protein